MGGSARELIGDRQNAGKSVGERLVIKLPSMQTSWSTTVAPALQRSVRTLGYDVSVRSRTTSVRPEFTAHGR